MIAGAELLPVLTPASTNPANEVAKKLTGRDYVSWSAAKRHGLRWTFWPRRCSRPS
jgi:hypothetical protein